MQTIKTSDASGRGTVEGYKVSPPALMHPYSPETIEAVSNVLKNAECQTGGANLSQFEADLKAYIGTKNAFVTNSGSSSLRLAALLCRVRPGDEVIVPGYTFCASAIPFAMSGAKLVWVDIDPDTWTIDPKDVHRKITDKTKVIVAVHLLGMPANITAIKTIAEKHNLRLVEDCAQAPGAQINGRKVGTFGDFGCFSFGGPKNITTLGEGGCLTVRSDEDAKLVRGLRHNGCCAFEGDRERYWVPAMGNVDVDIEGFWPHKFLLGEAACAAGICELRTLDRVNDTLISQARKIIDTMADTPEISFAKVPEGHKHIYHQFIMHFDGSGFGKNRNDLLDILVNESRIRCITQYYPLYRYPLFAKNGFGEHDCPVLDKWWDNSFSYPWWAGMDDETIDYLTSSTKAAIEQLKK